MKERRCVYTVLMGGYEALREQPVASDSSIEFICFTDDSALTSDSWKVEVIDPVLPADPARSSRNPKILAHRHLAPYSASLYIDNTIELKADPTAIFDELLPEGVVMAVIPHSFRDTLAEEFAAVVEAGYEYQWVCEEQREHYRTIDPEALHTKPMAGGFILRRHHDPTVVAAMEEWWRHVLRYSRRDQLSMPVALRRVGLAPRALDIEIRESRFHSWRPPSSRHTAQVQQVRFVSEPEKQLEGKLADLRRERDHLDRMCSRLQAESLTAEEERERLKALVAGLEGERDHLQKAGVRLRRRGVRLASRVESVEAEVRALRMELARMRRSKSWGITAPFRRLFRKTRRDTRG